jgi:hypothetical protein
LMTLRRPDPSRASSSRIGLDDDRHEGWPRSVAATYGPNSRGVPSVRETSIRVASFMGPRSSSAGSRRAWTTKACARRRVAAVASATAAPRGCASASWAGEVSRGRRRGSWRRHRDQRAEGRLGQPDARSGGENDRVPTRSTGRSGGRQARLRTNILKAERRWVRPAASLPAGTPRLAPSWPRARARSTLHRQ